MTQQVDPVSALRIALRKLARDPRTVAFRAADPLRLLDDALTELEKRQSDICRAVLELDACSNRPLTDPLRATLQRYVYSDLPRNHADD